MKQFTVFILIGINYAFFSEVSHAGFCKTSCGDANATVKYTRETNSNWDPPVREQVFLLGRELKDVTVGSFSRHHIEEGADGTFTEVQDLGISRNSDGKQVFRGYVLCVSHCGP